MRSSQRSKGEGVRRGTELNHLRRQKREAREEKEKR
jgi:hypothetical protein